MIRNRCGRNTTEPCACSYCNPTSGLVTAVVDMIAESLANQEAMGCHCRECWVPTAEQIVATVTKRNIFNAQDMYKQLTDQVLNRSEA